MKTTRMQQLAGMKSLFEVDNDEQMLQWEEQAKDEFVQQYPEYQDKVDDLEVDPDGSVYYKGDPQPQRWPEGTVTPFDDWAADKQGSEVDQAVDQQDDLGADDQGMDSSANGSEDEHFVTDTHESHKSKQDVIKEIAKQYK